MGLLRRTISNTDPYQPVRASGCDRCGARGTSTAKYEGDDLCGTCLPIVKAAGR